MRQSRRPGWGPGHLREESRYAMVGDSPGAVINTTLLTKRYPGSVMALDGLTLGVPPAITGLVGANCAGQPTLIKLLRALLPPTKRRARVPGLDRQRDSE